MLNRRMDKKQFKSFVVTIASLCMHVLVCISDVCYRICAAVARHSVGLCVAEAEEKKRRHKKTEKMK